MNPSSQVTEIARCLDSVAEPLGWNLKGLPALSAMEVGGLNGGILIDLVDDQVLFLKRAHDPNSRARIAHEARTVTRLREDPGLRENLPTTVECGDDWIFMTQTGLDSTEALLKDRPDPDLRREFGRLGTFLGRVHGIDTESVSELAREVSYPEFAPISLELYQGASAAQISMLEFVQQSKPMGSRFRACSETLGSAPRRLIHGDLKLTNVLLERDPSRSSEPIVIDWEMAGLGHRFFDLAVLVAELAWLMIREAPYVSPDMTIETFSYSGFPLEAFRLACRELLESYAVETGHTASEVVADAGRLLPLCLLKTAWEYSAASTEIPPSIAILLQLSENLCSFTDTEGLELLCGFGGLTE